MDVIKIKKELDTRESVKFALLEILNNYKLDPQSALQAAKLLLDSY